MNYKNVINKKERNKDKGIELEKLRKILKEISIAWKETLNHFNIEGKLNIKIKKD